jgi:hypothetical protein
VTLAAEAEAQLAAPQRLAAELRSMTGEKASE